MAAILSVASSKLGELLEPVRGEEVLDVIIVLSPFNAVLRFVL